MGRTRGLLLFGIKVAISLALLYVAVHFVNFGVLRERLNRLNYSWIVAALTTLGLQLTLASLRWQRIAEFGGGRLSAGRAVLYTLIGSFFSQVLPSTVGGDAARIWLLARDAGAWKNAIFSVLIDRIAGLIWLAVLVLFCLPWSLALIANPIGRTALILIGVAGAAAPVGLLDAVAAWRHVNRTLESHSPPRGHRKNCLDCTHLRENGSSSGRHIDYRSSHDRRGLVVLRAGHRLIVYFLEFVIAHSTGDPDLRNPRFDRRMGRARERDDRSVHLCRIAGK